MRIDQLHLRHFRNIAETSVHLSLRPLTLFLGENGSGKTNVLEAVSLLSLLKSCRDAEEGDIAQWDQSFYRVRADVRDDHGEAMSLELVSERTPRRQRACLRNDVQMSSGAFIGLLPTVTFLPQDLGLFSGTPTSRRRFIDQILCQVSSEYVRDLAIYQRTLKQRNALLTAIGKGQGSADDLLPWDRALAAAGARITIARLELLQTFNCMLADALRLLGEARLSEPQLLYVRKGSARDADDIEKEFLALFVQYRERDVLLHATHVGSHRDDWLFLASGRNVSSFVSRGQERVCLLALLFLAVSYFTLRRGERPVILLDDVFSELDDAHQSALLAQVSGHQVLLTATHVPPTLAEAQTYVIAAGTVEAVH